MGQHRERARNMTVDGVGRAQEGWQSTEHPRGRREKVRLRRVRWRQGQRARSASSSERLRRGRTRGGGGAMATVVLRGTWRQGQSQAGTTARRLQEEPGQGARPGLEGGSGRTDGVTWGTETLAGSTPFLDAASECGLPFILAGRGGRRGSTWEGGVKLCLDCTELVDPVHLRCFSPPRPLCAPPRSPLHSQQ